jgi:hypothetical protein
MDWGAACTAIAAHSSLSGILAAIVILLGAWRLFTAEWDRVPRLAVRLDPGASLPASSGAAGLSPALQLA